jgi:hypothetical protein
MLQAHSFLWHYLWVAPDVLLLLLGVLMRRRGLHRQFPAFTAFAFLGAVEHLVLYGADLAPWVTPQNFWRIACAGLLVDIVLKLSLIGEIFSHLCGAYSSIAKLGKRVIQGIGVVLVFVAVGAAAFVQRDNPSWLISGEHLLEQTIFLIESGVLLSIFLFAAYFHLAWSTKTFGISLGLSISACVHLATWAVIANGYMRDQRALLDFLNMATYHVCVLIWMYYLLLAREKSPRASLVRLPEHNLEVLNHELERLIHQ